MRRLMVWALATLCAPCWATTYYVSSSSGSDANPGTQAQPFQTVAKVDGLSLHAGDAVYFKRGDTWNEQLVPPASGTAGSPITFDAYGTGAAPVLTPLISLAGVSWTHNSGNIYTTTLSTTITLPQINNLQLGTVWGRKRTANPGCTSAGVIVGYGDFCVVYPTLYLYSPSGTLPSAYYSSIAPVVGQASGLAVILVVNKSWLVFQHIKLQNFDYMGVSVTGSSDNLIFANMESDGLVPYGTMPHGFYVNAPSAVSIQFLNDDAHRNYDGFHVDGATAITITNCRGYANRDAGLKDATGDNPSPVTYSYSHFYGNNIAQFPTADVVGNAGVPAPIAGAGNISSTLAPVVTNFTTYPARFSFTVDDVGSQPNTESYIDTFLGSGPFGVRGLHFNAAVVPSYSVVWSDVNSWYTAGNEIDSHSWSHQYYSTNTNPQNTTPYPNAPAMNIQYVGSGTAATMTISGTSLITNVTGASGDNLNINLGSYEDQALFQYLQSLPHYAVQDNLTGWPLDRPSTHATNYLSVTNQDIKTTAYTILYDQTKLEPDEMVSSKAAIQSGVPGLTESFYVYPDGIEDPTIEADAAAAGHTAARGSLAMKGQDNTTSSANSLYSNGVNVQNITSLAAIQIHGMTQAQVNQIVASLIFRAAAWGVPYGFFTHYNSRGDNTPDINNTELGYLLDAVTANGGVWLTNMALAGAVSSGTNLSGSTRYIQSPTGAPVSLAVAGANSPTVGRGTATPYSVDLNGVSRSALGAWDIGACSYMSQRYGMGNGPGNTYIGWRGGLVASAPSATFSPNLLGGIEGIVTNSNNGPTVVCATVDGTTPSTSGNGATCRTGFALEPTSSGTPNPGYIALASSATVGLVAGTSGSIDSPMVSYVVNVPTQPILATNFGAQCGPGESTNCNNPTPPPQAVWPTSAAFPTLLRLHDSKDNWASLQPTSSSDWTTAYLDSYLGLLAAHPGVVGAQQFTTIPKWDVGTNTSGCGTPTSYGPNACPAPPADLTAAGSPSFNAYVTKFVQYCDLASVNDPVGGHCVANYIKVYQLFNEWDISVHWTGTMAQLYQMVAPAAAIIRANVPGAVITMPSATPASNTGLGYATDFQNWLNYENTYGRISDVVDCHDYLSSTSTTIHTPEYVWENYIAGAGQFLAEQQGTAGWNVAPFIDSETNYNGSPSPGLNYSCPVSATPAPPTTFSAADCAGMIARWQILHDAAGAYGLYWYYWNQTIGDTPAYATLYQNLQSLLIGGYFTAPATSDGNNPATWSAPFVTANNYNAVWLWTDSESNKTYTVSSGYSDYRDLGGGKTAVTAGQNITLTTQPIMLELQGGPPAYPYSSRSTAAGTVSYPFTVATPYNTTIEANPLNGIHDCVTVLTDNNNADATDISQGNLSYSGGANDVFSSVNTTYIGAYGSSSTHIYHLNTSGPCALNVTNGGQNTGIKVSGMFGFSRSQDNVFYTVNSLHTLTQNTITSDTTYTSATMFDFLNCPGPIGTTAPTSGSILGISLNDAVFTMNASWIGGQGTGRVSMAYKPGVGCAALDWYLGNYYNYCASNCGGAPVTTATLNATNVTFTMASSCAYTVGQTIDVDNPNAHSIDQIMGNWTVTTGCNGTNRWTGTPNNGTLPTGSSSAGWTAYVPSGTETVCTDPNYVSGSGLHDSQGSLDGTMIGSSGGCFNPLNGGNEAFWQIGTGNVLGVGGTPGGSTWDGSVAWSGHQSLGVNHVVQVNNPSPNIRTINPLTSTNVGSYTTIATLDPNGLLPGSIENHCWWPHPTGDDSYPWLCFDSDATSWQTPGYLQNEIYGVAVNNGMQTPIRFGPEYNSSTSSYFGCSNVGYGSQDGKWFFWLADGNPGNGNSGFGLDGNGKQECRLLGMKLD